MDFKNSETIYKQAINFIPGGVNSPVRAFNSVGKKFPIFVNKALGSKIFDENSNEYIDYIGSWGPMILGHNNPKILQEIQKELLNGTSYGLPTKLEVDFAQLITEIIPSIEMVRLTSSGTEAAMSAVRLARAHTKRNKILKFAGCYHGHSDSLLVSGGSGLITNGLQDSNGITSVVLKDTVVCDFGDIEAVRRILETKEIACIILEPVPANMGIIIPKIEYLQELREVCTEHSTLLIFDEVISGFRVALGGAQEYYGVTPDLTILGKIIGGGFPIGAFGGRRELMMQLSPVGNVYHAGTLSGNPISVRAGYSTLLYLKNNENLYKVLEDSTQALTESINEIAKRHEVGVSINRIGSLFTIFFTHDKVVETFQDSVNSSEEKYSIYFNTMLEEGIIVPPSKYEAHFISYAHTKEDFDKTLKAIEKAFIKISKVW